LTVSKAVVTAGNNPNSDIVELAFDIDNTGLI
jgi:hypothetical protein